MVGTLWRTLTGSLALVSGRISMPDIERAIRTKYSDGVEVATAREQLRIGLTPGERALFARHLATGDRVLDVGCASGRVSLALAEMGVRTTGCDVNPTLIGQAVELTRAATGPIGFLVADARRLGFRDGVFDAVLLVGSVVCYIRSRRERRRTFEDIRRILKPRGRLFVVTPSREYSWKFRAWFAAMSATHRALGLVGQAARDWEIGDRVGPAWSGDTSRLVYWYMYAPAELAADLTATDFDIVESDPDAYMMTYVARRR